MDTDATTAARPDDLTTDFVTIARLYCDQYDCTPARLLTQMRDKQAEYEADGFLLWECQMLDSSACGKLYLFPYGPKCSFPKVPERHVPVVMEGRASRTSTLKHVIPAAAIPAELPAELNDWTPPPATAKPKRRPR